jgi:non-specific protein-tyrosine kinase
MTMNLRAYLIPAIKWWWLLALASLVAAGATFLAVRGQPAIYQTRTTLIVGRAVYELNPNTSELFLNQQLALFYADIARRQQVRDATMGALGIDFLPRYTAQPLPNSQMIEIVVADTNALRAQAVANELAHQLILLSPASAGQQAEDHQTFVSEQLDKLQAAIIETEQEITANEAQLLEIDSATELAAAQQALNALRTKLSDLQGNYAALLATTQGGAANTLSVIEPAVLPTVPISTDNSTVILLATAIAFAIALGAAYLLEYLDDTIKESDDVVRALELPAIGAIGHIAGGDAAEKLIALWEPRSPVVDAFRVLSMNIRYASVDVPVRTLLLTSPSPGEGKSTVLANLAVVMAQAGLRVILVDSDLRRPAQHTLFGLANTSGLSNAVLPSHPTVLEELQPTAVPNLRVLTSGALPPNPAEILGSERMLAVISELKKLADIVLFDGPPALAAADTAILATRVDTVLLLSDTGRTRTHDARQVVKTLRQLHIKIAGVVLNRQKHLATGYYEYGPTAGRDPASTRKARQPARAARDKSTARTFTS